MLPPHAAVAPAPELDDIARKLGELAAGDVEALTSLRHALHRALVASAQSGEAHSLLAQALPLLDDPRIIDARHAPPLLAKIREFILSAADARARGTPAAPLAAVPASARPEFSPDALISPDGDRALLAEFIVEAHELLETGEAALLVLDSDPRDREALETLFRALHSIKGTSAFLGMEPATELAHHAETLLTRVRSGELACTADLSNLIFRAIDMLDGMITAIEEAEHEIPMVPPGYRDLLAMLRRGPVADGERRAAASHSAGQFRRLLSGDLTVRIRSGDIDRLAGLVQQLVLAHGMLTRAPAIRANPDLARRAAFVERLASELEELTTDLRTVPFSATQQRLARLARDAAYQNGKSIDIELEGGDVRIERVTADALADPLMHMVRNAIDHGIETVVERANAGKSPVGRLRIAAFREGGALRIELGDDGRGIDPQRLTRIARERGFVSSDATLTEAEAFALLFRPGFTTATVVTDLSGRGVGMDVVRTNVDALGGTIDVTSRVGAGTTFTIRLPYRTNAARDADAAWDSSETSIGLLA